MTSSSRLLVRNSGNDCNTSFIRDAYMQRVTSVLNADTMATASTLVFVNGEFWGVYNMRERYSPEYVESHYGVDKNNVTVIESDYSQVHTNTNADFVLSAGVEGGCALAASCSNIVCSDGETDIYVGAAGWCGRVVAARSGECTRTAMMCGNAAVSRNSSSACADNSSARV